MINPFKQFNKTMLPQLNKMWNILFKLDNMRGDEFINIKRSGAGTTVGLNLQAVRRRVAHKKGGGGTGTQVRRAITNEDAGGLDSILCNFFDSSGNEITTGVDGVDFNIQVFCNISNGVFLNESLPRLEIGDQLFVTQTANSPTEDVYVCVSNFQASEDCTCGV